jgi:hypothetical protein
MTRNYDTTNGLPYVRAGLITIFYGTDDDNIATVSFTENLALIDSASKTNILKSNEGTLNTIGISKNDISTQSFDLINPATGALLGQTMSLQSLFVGITSYIRKIQKEQYPDV